MKDLNASINGVLKCYGSLANVGQYVEVKTFDRNAATLMIKVDDIAGDNFHGTVKLIDGHVDGLFINDKVRFPVSSALRCYDEGMKPL